MAKTGWVHLGKGIQVRELADGQVEARRQENVSRLMDTNERRQRASKRNARNVHEFAGLAKVAEMSPTQAMEMRDTCGDDSDKQSRWLRDHPECRTENCGAARLPKKRIYSYGKRNS